MTEGTRPPEPTPEPSEPRSDQSDGVNQNAGHPANPEDAEATTVMAPPPPPPPPPATR
jgi:hypothetical protein